MSSKLTPKCDQDQAEDQAVICRLFEQVYSKGVLDIVNDIVSLEFSGSSSESPEVSFGPDGLKSHVIRLRTVFHGFTIDIDDLHVNGDRFEVSWTARGRHERRFLGIEPTCIAGRAGVEPHGVEIAVAGATIGTMTSGKIRESSMIWDIEELRQQLSSTVDASMGARHDKRRSPAIEYSS